MTTVLVTGGVGFVGSHTVDALLERGYRVRVLDNLDPQVHGPGQRLPAYWNNRAEFLPGDVRAPEAWDRALEGVEAVVHLAAAVGVGQSMYEIARYVEVNTLGTAILLDRVANRKTTVRKILIASSMSCYGEGAYRCATCGPVAPGRRPVEQMQAQEWEVQCPACRRPASPCATTEEKPLQPTSVYALAKHDQEALSLLIGKTYGVPVVALRYFNIYGPRQALSNPYTGVVAIFSSRLLNQQPPLVFEDGRQSRDFIHIRDIVAANLLALERPEARDEVFNIGTGRALSLLEVCRILQQTLGQTIEPRIVGKFREGDIRHCYADTGKAERLLGFKASVVFEQGLRELAQWSKAQRPQDSVELATTTLTQKGLLK